MGHSGGLEDNTKLPIHRKKQLNFGRKLGECHLHHRLQHLARAHELGERAVYLLHDFDWETGGKYQLWWKGR